MEHHQFALDRAFQALADPTRRAVVQRLAQGEATVSELAMPFEMALPSFLKHLRVLEDSGLVGSMKRGRIRTCALVPKNLTIVEKWFEEQRTIWEGRHRNLDILLTELKGKQP
jgi:DNA-binding transcriptional ArsR family regulator